MIYSSINLSFLMFCPANLFFSGVFCWQKKIDQVVMSSQHVAWAEFRCRFPLQSATSQVHVEMRYAWSLSKEDVSLRSEFGVRKKSNQ